jgi:penicillin-insensitive murein DD-endopeptidase
MRHDIEMRPSVLFACLSLLAIATTAHAQDAPATPSPGPQRIHGIYMNGCIAGASALPLEGPGYEVIRVSRNRYWGHERAVRFVQAFGQRIEALKLQQVYIGDISQPRGGRMSFGHASHQVGLDIDVWFEQSRRPRRPAAQREEPVLRSLVLKGEAGIDEAVWLPAHATLLKTAASFPEVDRIFVNKLIKQRLCQTDRDRRSHLAAQDRAVVLPRRPFPRASLLPAGRSRLPGAGAGAAGRRLRQGAR